MLLDLTTTSNGVEDLATVGILEGAMLDLYVYPADMYQCMKCNELSQDDQCSTVGIGYPAANTRKDSMKYMICPAPYARHDRGMTSFVLAPLEQNHAHDTRQRHIKNSDECVHRERYIIP